MICYNITYFFPCIFPIIFSYNREKATICKFIIVFFAVDKSKSTPIILHYCFGIIAAINNI